MSTRSVGGGEAVSINANAVEVDFGFPKLTVESLVELESLLESNASDKEKFVSICIYELCR